MIMAFSNLGYSANISVPSNQNLCPTSGCDQLGNILTYPSTFAPGGPSPDPGLVNFYSPAYAAVAQSRFFALPQASPPTGPSSATSTPGVIGVHSTEPISNSSAAPPPSLYSCSLPSAAPSLAPPPPVPTYSTGCRDFGGAWRSAAHLAGAGQSAYSPYDHTGWHSPYAYTANSSLDLNSARRKNATRESTATLKAWLQEHIKNPYPTKGEKIMLAIITKMTLTQVSTWFANARRRLKKENKMTWSPRNRADDTSCDMENTGKGDDQEEAEEDDSETMEPVSRTRGLRDEVGSGGPLRSIPGLIAEVPARPCLNEMSPSAVDDCTKPKIWSLARTAISGSPYSLSTPATTNSNANSTMNSNGTSNNNNNNTLLTHSGLLGKACFHPYPTLNGQLLTAAGNNLQ